MHLPCGILHITLKRAPNGDDLLGVLTIGIIEQNNCDVRLLSIAVFEALHVLLFNDAQAEGLRHQIY
jgi:hypothetical protein